MLQGMEKDLFLKLSFSSESDEFDLENYFENLASPEEPSSHLQKLQNMQDDQPILTTLPSSLICINSTPLLNVEEQVSENSCDKIRSEKEPICNAVNKELIICENLMFGTKQSINENLENIKKLVAKRKIKCSIKCCDSTFTWKSFVQHYRRIHDSESHKCPNKTCTASFNTLNNACLHYLACTQHEMHRCPACNTILADRARLQHHFIKCLEDSPYLANNKPRSKIHIAQKLQIEKADELKNYLNTQIGNIICCRTFNT